MKNILIVEDDMSFQEVLHDILEENNFNIMACVTTEDKAVEYAVKYKPDIILMDIQLKNGIGISALKRIENYKKEYSLNIKTIIISAFYNKEYVEVAMNLNIAGYILKENIREKLIHIIKSASLGITSYDNKVITINRSIHKDERIKEQLLKLSKREKEIIRYVARGKKNAEIASELHISKGRVKNIITSINQKIETKNSKEIAVFGYKAGLN